MYMLHLPTHGRVHKHTHIHRDTHTPFVLGPVFSGAALKVPTSAPQFLSVADLGGQPVAYSERESERGTSPLETLSFSNEVLNAACCP